MVIMVTLVLLLLMRTALCDGVVVGCGGVEHVAVVVDDVGDVLVLFASVMLLVSPVMLVSVCDVVGCSCVCRETRKRLRRCAHSPVLKFGKRPSRVRYLCSNVCKLLFARFVVPIVRCFVYPVSSDPYR